MARKYGGEKQTKGIAKVKRSNGDTYVYERTYQYDQQSQKTIRLSNKLIGKIVAGTTEMVPTRDKRPDGQGPMRAASGSLNARRTRGSMLRILDWAGKESGIDADVYGSMDVESAQKTISLARFLTATGGDTIPNMEVWELTHPGPFDGIMDEDVCYDLFDVLGTKETIRQCFFKKRIERLGPNPKIAVDSSTVSTYSMLQVEARMGFNKEGDGLKTVKILILYEAWTHQPIAFWKQPGNIPDVIALPNAIKQIKALGAQTVELIFDNGFCSDKELGELTYAYVNFLTRGNIDSRWIHPELDKIRDQVHCGRNLVPGGGGVYCQSVRLTHTFKRERRYASKKKNKNRGDEEAFPREIWLHFCFDPTRKEQSDVSFFEWISSIKSDLERGTLLTDLKKDAANAAKKYLIVTMNDADEVEQVEWNDAACAHACQDHGWFVLISSRVSDGFQALRDYRKREGIEELFHYDKEYTDGRRTRVWTSEHLMGRMMVQFVALCYEDFLRFRIHQVKEKLMEEVGAAEREKKPKNQYRLQKNLLVWLRHTSFHTLLQWFDAYEDFEVSDEVRKHRWNAETTERDRLFLSMLGMPMIS